MKRLLVVVSLLSVVPAMLAQDVRSAAKSHRFVARTNATAHVGVFAPPPDEDDTLFVTDVGPDLDTDCLYSDHGPININVQVKRWVGVNKNTQIQKGLLSEKARLIMPAWDVDIQETRIPNEIDKVYFNGNYVGNFDGRGGLWKLNTFEIPIDWVNFAQPGNGFVTPGDNYIRVDIDTNGTGVWCTAVDWVEIEFKAAAPILLVHGTNANSTSWEPDFTQFLFNVGIPWSNNINLAPNGPIIGNGAMLARRVAELAHGWGAKKVNIIAHSKGGLDTRAYLNNNYDPDDVKVSSVYTLSTPHHGTIVSDIVVAARAAQNATSNNADIRSVIAADSLFQSSMPQEPAISNQKTDAMADFNRNYSSVPSGVRFYNYGADANANGNDRIEKSEAVPLMPAAVPAFLMEPSATSVYRVIGNVATIRLTTAPALWGSGTWTSIDVARINNPFAYNDLVVSEASAHSPSGTYLGNEVANHSSIKSTSIADRILQRIASDDPNRW